VAFALRGGGKKGGLRLTLVALFFERGAAQKRALQLLLQSLFFYKKGAGSASGSPN